MIEWIFDYSPLTNGMVLSLIISLAIMAWWAHSLASTNRIAEEGAKFLMSEVVKGIGRESLMLKSIVHHNGSDPEALKNLIASVNKHKLSPDKTLVGMIAAVREMHCDCSECKEENSNDA